MALPQIKRFEMTSEYAKRLHEECQIPMNRAAFLAKREMAKADLRNAYTLEDAKRALLEYIEVIETGEGG